MSQAATLVLAWVLLEGLAIGQTVAPPPDHTPSRAAALDAARAERERTLTPESPGWLERTLVFVEDKRVLQRLNPPEGVYPVAGSITRGGGLGLGAGYRQRPWQSRLFVDASGAWSYRNYKRLQASVSAPRVGGSPIEVGAGVRWYDYPQEDFFGLGTESRRLDRVSFALRGTDTFAQAAARPSTWLVARVRVGRQTFDVSGGRDPRFPSIEETFSEPSAPGLTSAPTLGYGDVSLAIDTRDQAGNTRSGGLYSVTLGAYRDGSQDAYDFNRVDVTLLHVIPIFDKKRGIALRVAASHIDPLARRGVPFFLMPTVGGSDSLRGYRDFRFRDTSSLVLNAEYRWEAFSGLDLALFADAGDVGPTWRSLVETRLRSSWGMGFRFNTNKLVFTRIDVGRGGEGTRIWIAFGPVFRR